MTLPTADDLARLSAWDTPTICNALEVVAPERRTIGFTTETMVCPFPDRKPMVGYARTGTIRAMEKPAADKDEMRQARLDYYRYVANGDLPKIVVCCRISTAEKASAAIGARSIPPSIWASAAPAW